MFDFGDELTFGIYRFPWLIWIQLVVTFLLIILLYYFAFFAIDPSIPSSSHSHNNFTSFTSSYKVGESRCIRGEIATSSSRRTLRGVDIGECEDILSSKSATHFSSSENCYHPCYYFELAKQAFLKCFGLDFTSESCSTRKRNKED